jgi:hypothetical protein
MTFVYLHGVWFAAWIVVNETPWRFDPYPPLASHRAPVPGARSARSR